MVYQPVLTVPPSSPSSLWDRTLSMQVTVNIQLSRPGEGWYGSAHFRYRIGAGAWTYAPGSTTYYDLAEHAASSSVFNSAYHTFAGSTFTAGDYEMQVEVQTSDAGGVLTSGWSASVFFSMGTPPAAPTILTPAAAATVIRNQTITWTSAASQVSAQMQVLNGASVEWDSGEYAITGTAQSQVAVFSVNSVTRTFQVRQKSSGGLWSGWATRSFNVSYVNPMVPTLSVVAVTDRFGIGSNHAVGFTVTMPTATGGAPAVTSFDVYVRITGSGATVGVLVGTHASASAVAYAYCWFGARHGVAYDIRVVAKADDGTSSTSTWATVSGTPSIRGVLLHSLGTPVTANTSVDPWVANLLLNDFGAEDDFSMETGLVVVAGREFPMVEYGSGSQRRLNIPTLHSEGIVVSPIYPFSPDAIIGTTDLDRLKTVLLQRKVVCYQDRRGRVVYGLATIGSVRDKPWGNTFSLVMDQTYSDRLPPSDVLEAV